MVFWGALLHNYPTFCIFKLKGKLMVDFWS